MIHYSTNWMGPVSLDWTEKHGNCWAAGRIDIYGTDSAYPEEYALSMMHRDDWSKLTRWLDTFKTADVMPYEELIAEYEKVHGEIRWWEDEYRTSE